MKEFEILLHSLQKILPDFPSSKLKELENSLIIKKIKCYDRLIQMGSTEKTIGFVLEGILKKSLYNEKGREFVRAFVRQGEMYGVMRTLIIGLPSELEIIALSDVTTIEINFQKIVQKSETDLVWSQLLMKVFQNYLLIREKREEDLLRNSASERYEEYLSQFGDDAKKIPLIDVASYLGITNVSLSRIRKHM